MLAVPACKYRAVIDANKANFLTFADWAIPIITVSIWLADERTLHLGPDQTRNMVWLFLADMIDNPDVLADFMQQHGHSAPKIFRAIR